MFAERNSRCGQRRVVHWFAHSVHDLAAVVASAVRGNLAIDILTVIENVLN